MEEIIFLFRRDKYNLFLNRSKGCRAQEQYKYLFNIYFLHAFYHLMHIPSCILNSCLSLSFFKENLFFFLETQKLLRTFFQRKGKLQLKSIIQLLCKASFNNFRILLPSFCPSPQGKPLLCNYQKLKDLHFTISFCGTFRTGGIELNGRNAFIMLMQHI